MIKNHQEHWLRVPQTKKPPTLVFSGNVIVMLGGSLFTKPCWFHDWWSLVLMKNGEELVSNKGPEPKETWYPARATRIILVGCAVWFAKMFGDHGKQQGFQPPWHLHRSSDRPLIAELGIEKLGDQRRFSAELWVKRKLDFLDLGHLGDFWHFLPEIGPLYPLAPPGVSPSPQWRPLVPRSARRQNGTWDHKTQRHSTPSAIFNYLQLLQIIEISCISRSWFT